MDTSNWWEHFFEGLSVKLWLEALSQEHTDSEADTIARLLGAAPGAELLDVPCGGGRLSLALAERGYRLTGVDVSREFLEHARSCDGADRVNWEHREMRDLPWPGRFDGAFCVGNSFGYLDDEGNAAFLRAVPQRSSRAHGSSSRRRWSSRICSAIFRNGRGGRLARCTCSCRTSTTTREVASTSNTRSCRTAAPKCGTARTGLTDTRNCTN